ncbi:MAG: ABC transporter permease [Eubacterium coprostanoligenes]|uniref:Putative ABC transport system permease protein n=1 Tax=Eubacterium coprostanoligenes TaxID=290054 RepID=A0A1T4LD30_9FIRM|nr:ABC transporter permease [Eubacterium coprostanoligenes]MCI7265599.1 ABC transporter permease [Eubacterium coprostanoligenes]MDY4699165.1 ABC transporter permease [Eubacterium coprostanoligenes]SJZ52615.1 putative ABC transport system permease protein [Eubacterium coprostanoligenes]
MNITESLKIAVKCIKANWMRSVLTMLGIIIGITSVIMIVGAGTGVRDYIIGLIEDMGSNAVLVSVDTTQATDNDYITLDDVDNIKAKVSGVERCSPMLMGFGNATIDATATEATVMMVGVNSDVQFAMTNTCEYGRFFTDEEYAANAPIAVMGLESAKTAFGYEDATGQSITVSSSGKSMKIKVCGVANIDAMVNSLGGGTSIGSMFQTNSDKPMIALFMPCTTLTQITGASANLSNVFVIAEEGKDYDTVGNATVNYLKAVHGNYSNGMYTAQNMATYIEIVDIIMKVLTIFIAGVGAISLIVGGIGVMNIMLVSVTERTREIGIRKSLGAKTRVITMQFLTESIILCLIGGFIGVVLGVAGAFAACSIIDITPKISIWLILLALLFSSGVGLFFGIYPAKKAAQLSPIDALRSE